MARMRDVAQLAGVSITVVSQVLGNRRRQIAISENTCARVMQAANHLDYVPDSRARLLRQSRSTMVGVLVSTLHSFTRPMIIDALSEELAAQGLEIILGVDHRQPETALRCVRMFRAYRTRGVIAICGSYAFNPEIFNALRRGSHECGRTICISLVRSVLGMPQVRMDVRGVMEAFGDAVKRGGYRQAFLMSHSANVAGMVETAFEEALVKMAGVEGGVLRKPNTDFVQFVRTSAADVRSRLLTDGPVAVLTTNDSVAIGLMQELQEAGVRIPDEVGVIGYGDSERLGDISHPTLSAFDLKAVVPEFVRPALKLLMEQDDESSPALREERLVLPHLALRGSFLHQPLKQEGRSDG